MNNNEINFNVVFPLIPSLLIGLGTSSILVGLGVYFSLIYILFLTIVIITIPK